MSTTVTRTYKDGADLSSAHLDENILVVEMTFTGEEIEWITKSAGWAKLTVDAYVRQLVLEYSHRRWIG